MGLDVSGTLILSICVPGERDSIVVAVFWGKSTVTTFQEKQKKKKKFFFQAKDCSLINRLYQVQPNVE